MRRKIWKIAGIFAVIGLAINLYGQQAPQGPPAPANLKVLPKDITRQQLMGIMNAWSRSLGVKCDHCHVADKASDEKPEKDVARAMVKMMGNLRQNAKDFFPDDRIQKVSCWTCHRGSAKIEMPPPPPPPPPPPAPKQ